MAPAYGASPSTQRPYSSQYFGALAIQRLLPPTGALIGSTLRYTFNGICPIACAASSAMSRIVPLVPGMLTFLEIVNPMG